MQSAMLRRHPHRLTWRETVATELDLAAADAPLAALRSAVMERNLGSIGWAIAAMAMAIVIFCDDQLFFRPLIAWVDKYRPERVAAQAFPRCWVLDLSSRSAFIGSSRAPIGAALSASGSVKGSSAATRFTGPSSNRGIVPAVGRRPESAPRSGGGRETRDDAHA
jgi:ABC-type anion transport system duplicated permease subunit